MYESFYELTGKPFKLSPDPHFFYESPHHGKAISYLRYGLELGEGFIVITGPVGTGKTTIARSLLSTLDESIVAAQISTTRLSPDELVKMVAAEFGLKFEGLSKADILSRLETYLHSLHSQSRRALLIIDEAQNLPSETIEELRMLSNFQVNDSPLIQSFLLGQEELKPIIEQPDMEQFRQRIIASCHLKPFTESQTNDYILHRLTQAGWNGKPVLGDDIFSTIFAYTKGVPRKINLFMDRLFLYAFMEGLEKIELDNVASVVEEIDGELSGGLQTEETEQTAQPEQTAQSDVVEPPMNSSTTMLSDKEGVVDSEHIFNTLAEVSTILDDVIHRKTLTIKHLDKMIREKRRNLVDFE